MFLVCACPGDTAATSIVTGESTGMEGSSGTSGTGASGATSETGDPTEVPTGSSDTGAGSTGGSSTGGMPPGDCLPTIPAPVDCGEVPEACGGAMPIAGGPGLFVSGSAVSGEHVWFLAAYESCPTAFYRAPRGGGAAQWVRELGLMVDYAGDDDAVYFVEQTGDPYTMQLSAWVDGVETVLGETHGDPRFNSYFATYLTRTRAGVVTYDSGGPMNPPFALLTPTAMTVVGHEGDEAYLGSEPAYDGQRLFYSLSDPKFDDEEGHVSVDRRLVARMDGASVVLAENASARGEPTVVVDEQHVYFATGSPSEQSMGISRVAKSGGAATPLFVSADLAILKLLVDDTHVYYYEGQRDIYAVEKSGGAPRHVWHGGAEVVSRRIQQDADSLYVSVSAAGGDVPVPGREFVVRVAKDSEVP